MKPSTVARIHAALLYLYPPSFRRRHGLEMRQFVRLSAGACPPGTLLWRLALDTMSSAPREWLEALRARRATGRPRHGRRPGEPMTNLMRDIRYAARTIANSPGFTLAAVLTLALGIGGNTAAFTLADAVLLRPVHVRDPHELFVWSWSSSYPDFREYMKRTDVFRSVAAVSGASRVNIVLDGSPELAWSVFISGNGFDAFGVGAAHGRPLLPSDDEPGAAIVGVLGHDYWRSGRQLRRRAADARDRPACRAGREPCVGAAHDALACREARRGRHSRGPVTGDVFRPNRGGIPPRRQPGRPADARRRHGGPRRRRARGQRRARASRRGGGSRPRVAL